MVRKKIKTFETGRKPHGFWQELKNVESELKKIARTIGHFPTQTEIIKLGYSGMIDAMASYHGGLTT